jgi:predicted dehydrogenase
MTVRVGVVGCGWWATTAHLPAVLEHPYAELAAIAEPLTENRVRCEQAFSPHHIFSDAASMLAETELDAVIVATPHANHYAPAASALARGLNVLVEKPMVLDPAQGRALCDLATKNARELIVSYPWHYNDQVVKLRDEIHAGRIGTIEHLSSTYASTARQLYRGNPGSLKNTLGFALTQPQATSYSDPEIAGGGQGQTQLTHSAALCLFLTGLCIRSVQATTARFELDVDLADAVVISFEDGAIGSLDSVGSVQPGQEEICEVRIFGDSGHILLDAVGGRASIHGPGTAVEQLPRLAEGARYPERAPATNLINVTRGADTNGSPGALGLRVVELLDAMYTSARQGRPVKVAA